MKKAPTETVIPMSACQQSSAKFTGTDNPRHLRALAVLLRRPITRQELDNVAGCSNGPELVAELRRRGLAVECERIEFIDRDGRKCRPGVYGFNDSDRRKVNSWLKLREQEVGK